MLWERPPFHQYAHLGDPEGMVVITLSQRCFDCHQNLRSAASIAELHYALAKCAVKGPCCILCQLTTRLEFTECQHYGLGMKHFCIAVMSIIPTAKAEEH